VNKVSKKSIKPYEKDKYVESWLKGLSPRTKENYLTDFADWLAFIGMTPTEQIEQRLKDTSSTNMTDLLARPCDACGKPIGGGYKHRQKCKIYLCFICRLQEWGGFVLRVQYCF
jgi:hypothetical protein